MVNKNLPFTEKRTLNKSVRTFTESTNSDEFKWHQDDEDRFVIPLHSTDWYVQLDNQLPVKLVEGRGVYIPKDVWHRVIKGSGNLQVEINFIL